MRGRIGVGLVGLAAVILAAAPLAAAGGPIDDSPPGVAPQSVDVPAARPAAQDLLTRGGIMASGKQRTNDVTDANGNPIAVTHDGTIYLPGEAVPDDFPDDFTHLERAHARNHSPERLPGDSASAVETTEENQSVERNGRPNLTDERGRPAGATGNMPPLIPPSPGDAGTAGAGLATLTGTVSGRASGELEAMKVAELKDEADRLGITVTRPGGGAPRHGDYVAALSAPAGAATGAASNPVDPAGSPGEQGEGDSRTPNPGGSE